MPGALPPANFAGSLFKNRGFLPKKPRKANKKESTMDGISSKLSNSISLGAAALQGRLSSRAAPGKSAAAGEDGQPVEISTSAQRLEAWRSWAQSQGLGQSQDNSLFAKYQSRLSKHVVAHFTDKDKALLGQAYQAAEGTGEASERNMEKIDKLANKLGAYRITQELDGELVKNAKKLKLGGQAAPGTANSGKLPLQGGNSAAQEEDDEDWNPIHLEILGEMKKMAGV
jgi:hypothetical protein